MKAFRAISIHKHFLTPQNRKFTSNPFHICSQSIHYTSFSSQFHRRFGSQAPSLSFEAPNGGNHSNPDGKSSKVWTFYDPLSGRLVTEKVRDRSGGEQLGGETQKGLSGLEDGVEEDLSEQKSYGAVKKAKSGGIEKVSYGDILGYKKKKKSKTSWVCSSCGYTDGQWWGMCRNCDAQGTMKEFSEGDALGSCVKINGSSGVSEKAGSWLRKPEDQVLPIRLKDVKSGVTDPDWRITL